VKKEQPYKLLKFFYLSALFFSYRLTSFVQRQKPGVAVQTFFKVKICVNNSSKHDV